MRPMVILLIVLALLAVGEGLYITYPSWSGLFAGFGNKSETATSTDTATTPVGPKKIVDHGQYYDITASYPGETPLLKSAGSAANARAISSIKEFEENTIAQFKTDGDFAHLTPQDVQIQGLGPNRKYALTMTYKMYSSPHTVSYVLDIYEDTLGAHGNTSYKTFTFNTATGAELSIFEIFGPHIDVLGFLGVKTKALLKASLGNDADPSMLDAGTRADVQNFQNFYLDKNALVILFAPYQVAAYAAGPQTVRIPFSSLNDQLNPLYE